MLQDRTGSWAAGRRRDTETFVNQPLYWMLLHFCGLAILVGINLMTLLMDPPRNGFFCNDESISYTYNTKEIFSMLTLSLVLAGILFLTICLTEILIWQGRKRRPIDVDDSTDIKCCKVNCFFTNMYRYVGGASYAFVLSQTLTNITKVTIGRLRPHFLDVCKPNWAEIKCLSNENRWLYVTDYICSGDAHAIKEARLSFFSGHSSAAASSLVYLFFYLQARLKWNNEMPAFLRSASVSAGILRSLEVLCPFLQAVVLSLGLFVGLTRVHDRWHHPTDVLAGLVAGSLCAIITAFCVHDWPSPKIRNGDIFVAGSVTLKEDENNAKPPDSLMEGARQSV